MDIHQLSANTDIKLAQLERQLNSLQQQLAQTNGDHTQLNMDIAALSQLKFKLKRSRDIAFRAHQLQEASNGKTLQYKRIIAIALCVLSGMGLLIIAGSILLR